MCITKFIDYFTFFDGFLLTKIIRRQYLNSKEAEFELVTSLPNEDPELTFPPKKRSKKPITDNMDDDAHDVENEIEEVGLLEKSKKDNPKVRHYENKKARLRRQGAQIEEGEASSEQISAPSESPVPRKTIRTKSQVDEPKPTKPVLIVRNIPFQATQDELIELFRPVGGLLNVRLPQKTTGGHRGFGFVEFSTIDQASVSIYLGFSILPWTTFHGLSLWWFSPSLSTDRISGRKSFPVYLLHLPITYLFTYYLEVFIYPTLILSV